MKKYGKVFLVASLVIALDQLTKYLICLLLPLHHRIEVFRNYFHIVHVRNPGIAFGLLTHLGSRFKILMLILISSVAVVLIGFFLRQIKEAARLQTVSFALILGGALGNLIDRFRFGEVIDFLDVHWYLRYHWPAFNLADSAITVGICLLLIDAVFDTKSIDA